MSVWASYVHAASVELTAEEERELEQIFTAEYKKKKLDEFEQLFAPTKKAVSRSRNAEYQKRKEKRQEQARKKVATKKEGRKETLEKQEADGWVGLTKGKIAWRKARLKELRGETE